jgi:hypothetical protein
MTTDLFGNNEEDEPKAPLLGGPPVIRLKMVRSAIQSSSDDEDEATSDSPNLQSASLTAVDEDEDDDFTDDSLFTPSKKPATPRRKMQKGQVCHLFAN